MTKFISNLSYAGLCNRLNTLISDLMLYDTIYADHEKIVYWPVLKDSYADLFKPISGVDVVTSYDKNIYKCDAKIAENNIYVRNMNGFIIFKDEIEQIKNVHSFYSKFNGTLCYTYDRTPQYFIDKYRKYINLLIPTNEISEEVDKYWCALKSDMDIKNLVGIHIRQGDFNKLVERRVDIDRFISKMKEIESKNKDTVFHLSTDNSNLYNEIKKKFPDGKIKQYEHTQDNRRHSDFKTALICLLILSKFNHLVLTNFSTYSQLAWWLGGCHATVDVISNKFQDKYHLQ